MNRNPKIHQILHLARAWKAMADDEDDTVRITMTLNEETVERLEQAFPDGSNTQERLRMAADHALWIRRELIDDNEK